MAKRDFKAQLARPEPSSFDREMYELHERNEIHENNEVNVKKDQNEADEKQFIPFSTRVTRGTFVRLKQAEYWERATITEIVETALRLYLDSLDTAAKPLPDKEQKRLAVRKLQVPLSKQKNK
jgi:hypothetical protein